MSSLEAAGPAQRDLATLKAILYVVAATGFFSVMFTSGKFAGDNASALQILFLRYVGGVIAIAAVALWRRRSVASMRSKRVPIHVVRVAGGAFGGVAIIFGTAHMPVVDATAISQLSVVFVIALGMLFLGERPNWKHFIAITVCVAGVGVVMASRGAFRDFRIDYLIPAAVTLLGAMLVSVEHLMIKILTRIDDPLTTLAHANVLGTVMLAVPAILTWQDAGMAAFAFLALGPLAITAQYFNVRGYTLADVSVLAPVKYTALIFAAIMGWVFFAEVPTVGVLAGAGLIAAGGIALALIRR